MSTPDKNGVGGVIASQCCDSSVDHASDPTGHCKRFVGTDSDADCISGSPPNPYTYAQAAELCGAQGLVLCAVNCDGTGCGYNWHSVWTSISC